MDILKNLNEQYEIVSSEPANSEEEIQQLIEFSEITVPEEYLNIIRQQTELSILVKNCSYKCYIDIRGAVVCLDMNKSLEMQRWIPGSLAIADNGGGVALFYATGPNGFGVYAVGFGDLDIEDAVYISRSLEELLVHADGIDIMRKEVFYE